MKIIVSLLLALGGFSAAAVEVSFKCSPKAFSCAPGGDCRWTEMYEGVLTTVRLDQDDLNPGVHRARYQSMIDGHQLTLDFRYNEENQNNPLKVNAYLGAANVMAESSGNDRVDVALRNNNYGRGYVCSHIRVKN
jgi:hypothetical protein